MQSTVVKISLLRVIIYFFLIGPSFHGAVLSLANGKSADGQGTERNGMERSSP